MNPSLIDASGKLTEEYLIAHSLLADQNDPTAYQPQQQQPQPQPPHLPQQQRRSSSIANNGYQPQPHVASPSQQQQQQQQTTPTTEGPVANRGYGSVHEPPKVNGGVAAATKNHLQQQQQLLSSRNVSIHNHQTSVGVGGSGETSPGGDEAEDSPLSEPFPLPPSAQELDQTTMIGSALDLDSLGGDALEEMALEDNGSSTVASSSQGGSSQVGLIQSQPSQQQQHTVSGAV